MTEPKIGKKITMKRKEKWKENDPEKKRQVKRPNEESTSWHCWAGSGEKNTIYHGKLVTTVPLQHSEWFAQEDHFSSNILFRSSGFSFLDSLARINQQSVVPVSTPVPGKRIFMSKNYFNNPQISVFPNFLKHNILIFNIEGLDSRAASIC